MGDFFTVLWVVSLLCLVAGLAKPSLFSFLFRARTTRKVVGITLGTVSVVLLLVAGALAEPVPEAQEPATTPMPRATSTPASTSAPGNRPTPSSESQAIRTVAGWLSGNELGISEKDLRAKPNPKGQGTFVYSSQTTYSGVERRILWLVVGQQAYPLNGATQGVTPNLKLPREAPEDVWRSTGLDKYSAEEAITIVFGEGE